MLSKLTEAQTLGPLGVILSLQCARVLRRCWYTYNLPITYQHLQVALKEAVQTGSHTQRP